MHAARVGASCSAPLASTLATFPLGAIVSFTKTLAEFGALSGGSWVGSQHFLRTAARCCWNTMEMSDADSDASEPERGGEPPGAVCAAESDEAVAAGSVRVIDGGSDSIKDAAGGSEGGFADAITAACCPPAVDPGAVGPSAVDPGTDPSAVALGMTRGRVEAQDATARRTHAPTAAAALLRTDTIGHRDEARVEPGSTAVARSVAGGRMRGCLSFAFASSAEPRASVFLFVRTFRYVLPYRCGAELPVRVSP